MFLLSFPILPKVIKIFLVITLFVLLSFIGVIVLAVDTSSKIQNVAPIDISSADHAKVTAQRLLKTVRRSIAEHKELAGSGSENTIEQITVTAEEAASLASLAHRAMPKLRIQSGFVQNVAQLDISYQLPWGDYYLNVSTMLFSSQSGLSIGKIKLGSLSFSSEFVLSLVIKYVDKKIQPGFGQSLIDTVKHIVINQRGMMVGYQIPSVLSQSGEGTLSKLFRLRDDLALFGDVDSIKYYYTKLVDVAGQKTSLSLADYLSSVITPAYVQTEVNGKNASEENYAALMALVLYFGHDKFELLVGDISNLTVAQRNRRDKLRNTVTLNGRVDLQKHFMYSVALKLFGNVDASDALGEFKELLDANGGSGFSFADLLADRVGTRFAVLATSNDSDAYRLQQHFGLRVHERSFMPEHIGLPEGIDQATFERTYANTQSQEYKVMIADIDRRLAATELYRLSY